MNKVYTIGIVTMIATIHKNLKRGQERVVDPKGKEVEVVVVDEKGNKYFFIKIPNRASRGIEFPPTQNPIKYYMIRASA